MKSIVLNVDSKCNAMCAHCCFSCGPCTNDRLTDDEIDNILEYISESKDIKEVAITGGEPMLQPKTVKKIISRSHKANKVVTLISNGFWGESFEKADDILSELCEIGLNALTISYDEFHAEYIPVENVKNILCAIKKYNVNVAVNMVVDKKHRGTKVIEQLDEALFGVRLTKIPASRVGRSHKILENDLYFFEFQDEMLCCPATAWEFVIHHDGYVYPCCSPSVFETNLRIGNIRKETIEEIDESLWTNGLLFILKKEGLIWFVQKLGIDLKSRHFVSVCEVCQLIFSDADNISRLIPEIQKYYEDTVQ